MKGIRSFCSDFTHVTKHDLNSSGFNTAKTRANVSFEAIPFSKGYYSRKRSIFSLPNNTKSRQLSAPQILPHNTTNKISMSGDNLDLEIRGRITLKNECQIHCVLLFASFAPQKNDIFDHLVQC